MIAKVSLDVYNGKNIKSMKKRVIILSLLQRARDGGSLVHQNNEAHF